MFFHPATLSRVRCNVTVILTSLLKIITEIIVYFRTFAPYL